jgi:CelD/BcsL family acetyltransferase involved in cellulose biosynthesis
MIDIIDESNNLEQIEKQWNGLLEKSENRDVLHSHQWYRCWAESFTYPGQMLILAARDGERLTAVLPLMKQSYRRKGLSIKAVRSMTNNHSALFDFISDCPSGGLFAALLRKAFEVTKRKVIVLGKVYENSLILRYLEEASRKGSFFYLLRPVSERWTVRMEAPFEVFFNGRESKFKKNMRAAERKSSEHGPLKVLQPSGLEDLAEYLNRGYVLQSNGWKGRGGTAIMQNEQVRTFYNKLAVEAFKAGWLRYTLLANNGDDMSFMYCLGAFGSIHALEIGLDERFKNLGAGMVVAKKALEQAFEEKQYHTWDFGSGQDRWKRDWSNGRETQYTIFIFRKNPVGMVLHALSRYYHSRHPFQPYDMAEGRKGTAC